MTPNEPHEDVIDLMNSPLFESRLSYIIGSALDEKDLLNARADVAKAIFFISDSQADYDTSTCEDAATVLRTLSIINFNPDLECFVEVLNEHDKRTLEDCHADVVLCLDDYKFTLQARNSICMGLSTLCENLFNSFSSDGNVTVRSSTHWLVEYQHGLGMEMYYVNIDAIFFSMVNSSCSLLVECLYLEFGIMLIGVSRTSDHSVHMNPRNYERKFPSLREYYTQYSVGIVIAPDYNDVLMMQYTLTDRRCIDLILKKLSDAENRFTTRNAQALYTGGKNHEKKTLENLRQISMYSGMEVDPQINEHERAKVLSTLVRSQKYFDNKYSLKKCYQRANTRKTGTNKNLRKSVSMQSTNNAFESDSSSGDDMDNFLGYIDDDDDDDFSDVSAAGEGGDVSENSVSSMSTPAKSPMSNNNSISYTFCTRSHTEADKHHWSAKGGNTVTKSLQAALLSPTPSPTVCAASSFQPPTPTSVRTSRKAFISLSPVKSTRIRSEDAKRELEREVTESETETKTETERLNVNAWLSADIVKNKNGDDAVNTLTKRQQRLSKFGGAARKVTAMLKADDVWGDAVSIVKTVHAINLHAGAEETMDEPSFQNFPTITPLQRQIMQMKSNKKHNKYDSRSTGVRRRLKRVTSSAKLKQQSSRGSDADTDTDVDVKPVLKKGDSKNLAATLKSFQANQQNSFNRQASGDALHKLRSHGASSSEDEQSGKPAVKRNKVNLTVDTNINRRDRFQTKGAYSSIGGGTSGSEGEKDNKASRLRSFHKATSSVSSADSIDLLPSRVLAVDIGEIIGAGASPSVKRTLSKSKSKDITLTPQIHKFLRPDSFEEKNVSAMGNAVKDVDKMDEAAARVHCREKHPSLEIKNASALREHVIVLGCLDFLIKFVKALRKSNLSTHENYHSILIVSETEPDDWGYIKKNYKDVFFLRRSTKSDQDLLYMNLRNASSITMFGSRTRETLDEATNIDSMALFLYLGLERKIPSHVNITVEIFRPSSVGVINSAINHNQTVLGGGGIGTLATGISRKGTFASGKGLKIGGNDHKSFYVFPTLFDSSEGDDDDGDDDDGDDKDKKCPSKLDDQDFAFKPRMKSYRQEHKIFPLNISAQSPGRMSPGWRGGILSPNNSPHSSTRISQPDSDRTTGMSKQDGGRNAGRARLSVAGMTAVDSKVLMNSPAVKQGNQTLTFWGSADTHHVMPVFAAGRAFVPTAFDSIFIQVSRSA